MAAAAMQPPTPVETELAPKPASKIKFPPHSDMRAEMNRRVDAYFEETGLDRHGGPSMWFKTVFWMTLFWGSYAALLLWSGPWWEAALCAAGMGLGAAGIGFCIMHDGNHGSYSPRKGINRLTGYALDAMGGSSWMWKFKHNILHHSYPNLLGFDDDIEAQPFLRMASGQRRHSWHRIQFLYFWLAYAFLPVKWHFVDDYRSFFGGKINGHPAPRPRGSELFMFFFGKLFMYSWAFIIPLALGKSLLWVLGVYAVLVLFCGVTLGTVFQLAHCVDGAEFPNIPAEGESLEHTWVKLQLATTVDFSPRSWLVTWVVGGLNFQVEHHLYPRICHVHYPAIQKIVQETCAEFGVTHHCNQTLWQAIGAHVRHLWRLGLPVAQQA